MKRILILGGSALTASAAHALQSAGHMVRVYWSRAAKAGQTPVAKTLRAGVAEADVLVDATHPFDSAVPHIAAAFRPTGPAVRLARPPWTPGSNDAWVLVDDIAAAVAALPAGARVFAASGRDSAEVLAHHDGPVFLRQLQKHTERAPPGCTYVFGQGPFSVPQEVTLFQDLNIDVLLARNTGGDSGFPKVAAAQELGLSVVLITPPDTPFRAQVHDADALVAWIETL